jgi:type II secretory pathway pseudopilin PulG
LTDQYDRGFQHIGMAYDMLVLPSWDSFEDGNMTMLVNGKSRIKGCSSHGAFTLMELLVSVGIFAMVIGGILYGYVQANRFALWTSMSYAAQSYALQGLEEVRAAKWDLSANPVWDDIPAPTNYITTDIMDVPVTGAPYSVTNYITLTNATLASGLSSSVQLRMITSQCVWVFPFNGRAYTNTVVTFRAPDKS